MDINCIYNDDSLGDSGMCLIPDKSVDLILTDLPYGTTSCSWDVILPFDKLWGQYERIIKDNGAIVLFGSQPFTSLLVASNIRLFKYCCVWEKAKPTMFQMANYRPMKKHEDIAVFSKAPATSTKRKNSMVYNPQGVFDCERVIKRTFKSEAVNGGKDTSGSYMGKKSGYPHTILRFSGNIKNRIHDTQKPNDLLDYLIRTYSNEGDLVLDNCMGSGSLAVSCVNTNRNFIGFEWNPKKPLEYYPKAIEWVRSEILKQGKQNMYENMFVD